MDLAKGSATKAVEDVRIQKAEGKANNRECRPFSRCNGSGANATWRRITNVGTRRKWNYQTETNLSRGAMLDGAIIYG